MVYVLRAWSLKACHGCKVHLVRGSEGSTLGSDRIGLDYESGALVLQSQ